MTEVFKTGDYGHFHFTVRTKHGIFGHDLHAKVVSIEKKYVELLDNDDQLHIPLLKDIDFFEAKKEPVR